MFTYERNNTCNSRIRYKNGKVYETAYDIDRAYKELINNPTPPANYVGCGAWQGMNMPPWQKQVAFIILKEGTSYVAIDVCSNNKPWSLGITLWRNYRRADIVKKLIALGRVSDVEKTVEDTERYQAWYAEERRKPWIMQNYYRNKPVVFTGSSRSEIEKQFTYTFPCFFYTFIKNEWWVKYKEGSEKNAMNEECTIIMKKLNRDTEGYIKLEELLIKENLIALTKHNHSISEILQHQIVRGGLFTTWSANLTCGHSMTITESHGSTGLPLFVVCKYCCPQISNCPGCVGI